MTSLLPGCGGGEFYCGNDDDGGGDEGGGIASEVTAVSPQTLSPGMQCTITGSGFGNERLKKDGGRSYVNFEPSSGGEGVAATEYQKWTDTEIVCTVPDLPTSSRQTRGE